MSNWVKRVLSVLLAMILVGGAGLFGNIAARAIFTATPMIAAGYSSTFALKSDGTVWAWGSNYYGQLGNNTAGQGLALTPAQVQNLNNMTAIAAGAGHVIALKNDGTVWSWGSNNYGQLGIGTTTNQLLPVQILSLSGITAIAAGLSHSIALKSDGTVWAWGRNNYGKLGDNTNSNRNIPIQVHNLSGITAIAAGDDSSHALKSNGTVWAWGHNGNGQLGDDTNTDRWTPVQVHILNGVTAIAKRGSFCALALKNDGTVWTWGQYLDDFTGSYVPIQMQNLSGISAVAGGGYHSVALKNGTVWAWGYNSRGQLGNNTISSSPTPVQAQGLSDVTAIAACDAHTHALKNDGTVWGWGDNEYGQLGDGTTTNRHIPVQISGFNVNVGGSDITNAAVPVIFLQPEDVTADIGDNVILRVSISATSGMNLTYQWYSRGTNGNASGSPISGAISPTYLPPTGGSFVMYYYCVITNTDNTATGNKTAQVASNAAKVTIKQPVSRVEVDFGTLNRKLEINWKNDYFDSSATIYNHDLAIASLVLSDAAYSENGVEKTFDDLGFSGVKTYEYDDDNFINASHAIAKKEIGDFIVIAIAVRGTPSLSGVFKGDGGALEWLSGILGWINLASIKVKKNLLDYISNLGDPENIKIWITGHSRGAAVSNFFGAESLNEKYGQNNVFSYGFASPNTRLPGLEKDYKNVYVWKNSHDFLVTNTPILAGKYGIVNEFTPDEITKEHYARLTGKTYNSLANAANPFSSAAHSTEIYMAHLLKGRTVSQKANSKTIIVRCPVDIKVYNDSNRLVGSVTNNVVDTSINPEVLIWLDGDDKYISLPPEGIFTLDMTGTNDGTMSFHVGYTDLDTWDIQEEKAFRNVVLFDGKTMTSAVGDSITAPNTQLLVTNNAGTPIATVNTDGTETPINAYYTLTYNANGGNGAPPPQTVLANTNFNLSSTVPVRSGYIFLGWNTVATAIIDRFSPNESVSLSGNVTLYAVWLENGWQANPPKTIFSTKYEANFLNWILFFLCFGWLWMWF